MFALRFAPEKLTPQKIPTPKEQGEAEINLRGNQGHVFVLSDFFCPCTLSHAQLAQSSAAAHKEYLKLS